MAEGKIIWITGLSAAGKSTLAREVVKRLRALDQAVIMLDGDELRSVFGVAEIKDNNYDRDARLDLALQYARLCRMLATQGLTVVIATIALFKEVHTFNRENLPGYFEVFLDVPIDELKKRDPKGLYQRFDQGEIHHVAGLDLPVDKPASPDWAVDFVANRNVMALADELMQRLQSRYPSV